MSSRGKGRRSRYKVEDYFRDKGYLVANVEKSGKFVVEKDLFALSQDGNFTDKGFDLLILGEESVILCQVTSNKPKTSKWYRKFASVYANSVVEVLMATVEDYAGIRLQWYEPDGSITEGYVEKQDIPRRYN